MHACSTIYILFSKDHSTNNEGFVLIHNSICFNNHRFAAINLMSSQYVLSAWETQPTKTDKCASQSQNHVDNFYVIVNVIAHHLIFFNCLEVIDWERVSSYFFTINVWVLFMQKVPEGPFFHQ